VCLFLGVVAGGAGVRHLRQLDIHKPAYIAGVKFEAGVGERYSNVPSLDVVEAEY
jgi:hypothetical protein